jgi:hypothetical protein
MILLNVQLLITPNEDFSMEWVELKIEYISIHC